MTDEVAKMVFAANKPFVGDLPRISHTLEEWEKILGEDPVTDEEMAPEWEAMLSQGDEDDRTRVLNQDEIDSLLGFDSREEEEPIPPQAWNDWARQWVWFQKISMGFTFTPFVWKWGRDGNLNLGPNRIWCVGPFRFRLYWPWWEFWD